ncbi:hypothetical protein PanWU01x14_223440, partial [Parasponia andersonii]
ETVNFSELDSIEIVDIRCSLAICCHWAFDMIIGPLHQELLPRVRVYETGRLNMCVPLVVISLNGLSSSFEYGQLRERSAPLIDFPWLYFKNILHEQSVIPLLLNIHQSRFQFQHLVWAHFRG